MASCTIPPEGWFCTRTAGHEGPCAAHQHSAAMFNGWASPTLGRVYSEVEKLRADLAQNSESGIDQSLRDLLDAIELADTELTGMAA